MCLERRKRCVLSTLAAICALGLSVILLDATVLQSVRVLVYLYVACFLPVRVLSSSEGGQRPADQWIFDLLLGLALQAVLFLLACRFSLPVEMALVLPAIALCVLLARLVRRKGFPLTRKTDPVDWIPILVGIGCVLPWIILAVKMGAGSYPQAFWNVDSPFYLEHTHSLLESSVYPPGWRGYLGWSGGYHFGVSAMAACLALFGGVPPHMAMFGLAVPLIWIGVAFAAARFCRRAGLTGYRAALAISLLLLFRATPLLHSARLLLHGAAFPDVLDQLFPIRGFPQVGTSYGYLVFLLILTWLPGDRFRREPVAFVIWVGTLGVFKLPAFVGGLLVLTAWSGLRFLRERNFSLILPVFSAGLLGIILSRVFAQAGSAVSHLAIDPLFGLRIALPEAFDSALHPGKAMFGSVMRLLGYGLPLILPLVPLVLSRRFAFPVAALLIASLAPHIFTNVFTIYGEPVFGGDLLPSTNTLQVLRATSYFALGAVILAFACLRGERPRLERLVTVLLLVGIALPAGSFLRTLNRVLVSPSEVPEYADNTIIAPVLKVIPTRDSVLATNYLDYAGGLRQMYAVQLSSLFGHQCYAVNFRYLGRAVPDAAHRVEQQEWLNSGPSEAELMEVAGREGWTHLIIHKKSGSPVFHRLQPVSENEFWAAYDLRARKP